MMVCFIFKIFNVCYDGHVFLLVTPLLQLLVLHCNVHIVEMLNLNLTCYIPYQGLVQNCSVITFVKKKMFNKISITVSSLSYISVSCDLRKYLLKFHYVTHIRDV